MSCSRTVAAHSERLLVTLRTALWRKHLLWLSFSVCKHCSRTEDQATP